MSKRTVIMGLVILLLSPLAKLEAADLQKAGIIPPAQDESLDRAKQYACDCCQKCTAAKSTIKSQAEEDSSKKDGCEECCERCGKDLTPTPATPPEIIDKKGKGAPDTIEKMKQ
jgi:hypothetical protein